MENEVRPNDWYALFVETGEEDKVKERLKFRFKDTLRVLVPKRRMRERKGGIWSEIIRVLFPGYILVNGEININDYYQFKNVPGLLRFLRTGYELSKIDYHEMELINKFICNNETIGFSNVLIEGGKVVVVDGPLLSMEGNIVNIDHRKGRAKVQLNFLGELRTIDLGVSVLQPA